MTINLDEKFLDYVAGRRVSQDIPDDMLEELKEINEDMKKHSGLENVDYFDFPR